MCNYVHKREREGSKTRSNAKREEQKKKKKMKVHKTTKKELKIQKKGTNDKNSSHKRENAKVERRGLRG